MRLLKRLLLAAGHGKAAPGMPLHTPSPVPCPHLLRSRRAPHSAAAAPLQTSALPILVQLANGAAAHSISVPLPACPSALQTIPPSCSWEQIQRSGELRRMHRTHVHFASEPQHLPGNDWASVLLQVPSGL